MPAVASAWARRVAAPGEDEGGGQRRGAPESVFNHRLFFLLPGIASGEQESGENTADQHSAKTADGPRGAEDQHAEGQQAVIMAS